MNRDIKKAFNSYMEMCKKMPTAAKFGPEDIKAVIDYAEKDKGKYGLYEVAIIAMCSGYYYGYKAGQKDQKKKENKQK